MGEDWMGDEKEGERLGVAIKGTLTRLVSLTLCGFGGRVCFLGRGSRIVLVAGATGVLRIAGRSYSLVPWLPHDRAWCPLSEERFQATEPDRSVVFYQPEV